MGKTGHVLFAERPEDAVCDMPEALTADDASKNLETGCFSIWTLHNVAETSAYITVAAPCLLTDIQ